MGLACFFPVTGNGIFCNNDRSRHYSFLGIEKRQKMFQIKQLVHVTEFSVCFFDIRCVGDLSLFPGYKMRSNVEALDLNLSR